MVIKSNCNDGRLAGMKVYYIVQIIKTEVTATKVTLSETNNKLQKLVLQIRGGKMDYLINYIVRTA